MDGKAFLGPIGDDLPSLIPILFALVIYFSVFNMAFQHYQQVNTGFNDAKILVTLTETLKGDSFDVNADEFLSACKQLSLRGVKFKAAVIELPFDLSELEEETRQQSVIVNLINTDSLTGRLSKDRVCHFDEVLQMNIAGPPQSSGIFVNPYGDGEIIFECDSSGNPILFKCSNIPDEQLLVDSGEQIVSEKTKIISRFYPIAYLDKTVKSRYAVRVVFLVVAVWH